MVTVSSEIKWRRAGSKKFELFGIFDGKWDYVKATFKPYFFIRDSDAVIHRLPDNVETEFTDLRGVDGHGVVKVICETPADVGSLVKKIEEKGVKVYEGDIPYARRILIDNAFKVDYTNERVAFLDVELDDSAGFLDYGNMEILSYCVYEPHNGKYTYRYRHEFDLEADLLKSLYDLFLEKSVIVGWNVNFDIQHLSKRLDVLDKKYAELLDDGILRGANGFNKMRELLNILRHSVFYCYDLREEYRGAVRGLSSYGLDDVAVNEGIEGKIKRKGKVCELNRQELEEYNRRDVEIMVELDKKYGFLNRDIYLCNEVNLTMDSIKSALRVSDSLILRRLRELGYVAPNAFMHNKRGYSGAFVIEPKHGLHRNVALCDVAGLYPTVVIAEQVDLDGFGGAVVPYLMSYFVKRKQEEEQKKNKLGRDAYKILSVSLYGVFGNKYFRFFDERKAEKITSTGRKVLGRIENIVKSLGFEVLYGDTDSVFFKAEGVEDVSAVVDLINERIRPYRVALEQVFDKIVFFGEEGRGVKKRYIGISKDGKMKVRGVEIRRGDWCQLSKRVMMDVVGMVFEGKSKDEIYDYLDTVKQKLFSGEFDSELKITKSVRKGEEYKTKPKHYLLWEQARSRGLIPKDSCEISYYYKHGGNLALWTDGEKNVDYREYWGRQIKPPVERLLVSVYGADKVKVMSIEDFV